MAARKPSWVLAPGMFTTTTGWGSSFLSRMILASLRAVRSLWPPVLYGTIKRISLSGYAAGAAKAGSPARKSPKMQPRNVPMRVLMPTPWSKGENVRAHLKRPSIARYAP